MAEPDERVLLAGALKIYLEELRDTGVDELEYGLATSVAPAPQATTSVTPAFAGSLEDISNDLGDCRRCQLCGTRQNIVFGVGNCNAKVLFVGEAPGHDEDLQGEPFVDEAGQLLTNMIKAMGYERSEVYICYVIKCRPPEDRKPLPAEIATCTPFMLRQIQAVAPKAIVALGTAAAQTLLGSKEPISNLRGRFHKYNGIELMPTFHPAFLLKSPEKKRETWSDLQQVMKLLV